MLLRKRKSNLDSSNEKVESEPKVPKRITIIKLLNNQQVDTVDNVARTSSEAIEKNNDTNTSINQTQSISCKNSEPNTSILRVLLKRESKNDIIEPKINTDQRSFKIQDYLTDSEWKELLKDEFEKVYFVRINSILEDGYKKNIFRPPKELVFNAFNSTKLSQIKCVILGQDPYHDEGQAHGLSFSVPSTIDLPRTLKNIFAELKSDIPEFERDESLGGCLEKWTHEGVFLLNSFLTVEAHKPGSHSKIGWNLFTDTIISLISEKNDGCVFILWGNFAHKKEILIDSKKHKIIKNAHPSPLSFNKFFNCKCFSQTNNYLKSIGKTPINWSLK